MTERSAPSPPSSSALLPTSKASSSAEFSEHESPNQSDAKTSKAVYHLLATAVSVGIMTVATVLDCTTPRDRSTRTEKAVAQKTDAAKTDARVDAAPIVKLSVRDGGPFAQRSLARVRPIADGVVVQPGIPRPDRIVVDTGHQTGIIVEARSGEVLARLPAKPANVAPRAGVVTLLGNPPRLLRLRDARVLTPKLDAGAHTVAAPAVVASSHYDFPVAYGVSTTGEKLVGVATDVDVEHFILRPTPLARSLPKMSAIANAFGQWELMTPVGLERSGTPYPQAHDGTCVRIRVDRRGVVTCLEYLPWTTSSDGSDARWMDDGWYATSTYVAHESWGASTDVQ
jgi:hypothetical protein